MQFLKHLLLLRNSKSKWMICLNLKLKTRLTSIIRNTFIFKNGYRKYKYLVLVREETYFVKEHSDAKLKYPGMTF